MPFASILFEKYIFLFFQLLLFSTKVIKDWDMSISYVLTHKVVKGKFEPRKVELIRVKGSSS